MESKLSNNISPVAYKELMMAEYKKCVLDPSYFMKKYCKIQHPIKGTLKFELYPFQDEVLKNFRQYDKNVILKCRQMGITTIVSGYALWLMTFFTDKSCLVVATKQDTAKELVKRVRFMHENLPKWLRVNAKENNKLSLKLVNGSEIRAVSSSPDAARSAALSLLVLDEAAFINDAEEIWTAASPTISTGGKAIIMSTPNGKGNFFHKMWSEAEENKNGFNTIRLHWTLHPDYDQKWRDTMAEILGEKQAQQECDCNFSSSGNTVVDQPIIDFYRTLTEEPSEIRRGDLWIWEYPRSRKYGYMVTADVARGDGEDFSAFHVIDIESLTQVAEYKGLIDTTSYADLLVAIGTEYNDALLVVENSTVGWAVIQRIIDRNYPNLYYTEDEITIVDKVPKFSNKLYSLEKKRVPGFTTSSKTRPLLISKLNEYFKEKSVTIRSVRTLNELDVFIWHNNKPQAAPGYNDDLIMSLAIGMWVRDGALKIQSMRNDSNKSALDNIRRLGNTGAGIHVLGREHNSTNPYEMNVMGQNETLKWLL